MTTMIALIETLAYLLEESHREELENDHYGDDPKTCSYCNAIRQAEEMLRRHK